MAFFYGVVKRHERVMRMSKGYTHHIYLRLSGQIEPVQLNLCVIEVIAIVNFGCNDGPNGLVVAEMMCIVMMRLLEVKW